MEEEYKDIKSDLDKKIPLMLLQTHKAMQQLAQA